MRDSPSRRAASSIRPFVGSANRVDRRDMVIQTVARYMRRLTPQRSAFRVTPQFVVVTERGSTATPVLVDGFEAGYVWDAESTKGTTNPNTRIRWMAATVTTDRTAWNTSP